MEPAPFRTLPGDPSPPARAFWVRADDGIRLRLAHWPAATGPDAGPAGTILLFPGRTEYLEKYVEVGRELAAGGFHVLAADWRGQGMSDRLQADRRPGHAIDFADFQRDVVELVIAAQDLDLPQPWHLLAHSMGGAIGLGALVNELPVASAVFSAPMWGIMARPAKRLLATGLSRVAGRLGWSGLPAIGTGGRGSFVLDCPFNDNLLTEDGTRWGRMVAEAAAWPDLTLGGASYGWVGTAFAETQRLAAVPASGLPDIPVLVALGEREKIVAPDAIRDRVDRWPGAKLMMIEGGRHEAMFETPDRRARFMDAALAHFHAGA